MRRGLIVSVSLLLAVHCGRATTNDVSENIAQDSSRTKQLGYFTPNVFPYFPQPYFRQRPQPFRRARPVRPSRPTTPAPASNDALITSIVLLLISILRAPATTTASTTTTATTSVATTADGSTMTPACNAGWSSWGECVSSVNLQYRSRYCPTKTETEERPCPTPDPLELLEDANAALQQELDTLKESVKNQPQEIRCYMGMKYGDIADSALSASSEYSSDNAVTRARLDHVKTTDGKGGGWSAAANDGNQWVEVDFGTIKSVAGVILQGRSDFAQWVTTYKVNCDADTIQDSTGDKVFTGNSDRNTKIVGKFPEPLNCETVRILPQSYQGHTSLRFELIKGECFDEY